MDNFILEAVVRSLAAALSGRPLLHAFRAGEMKYALRFAPAPWTDLIVSLRPPQPCLYREPSRSAIPARPPDPWASLLARELEGATLLRLFRPSCDRVVEMLWETSDRETRTVVVELLGKSANLLLLDSDRKVVGYARGMASSFRAPVVGETYEPPIQRPGYTGVTWDPGRAAEYIGRFASGGALLDAAAAFVRGLSPALGNEIPLREEALADPVSFLAELLSAVREGRLQPVLYTPVPVEEMLRNPGGSPEEPLLTPFPLLRPPLPVATPIPEAEEATRLLATLLEARDSERSLLERLTAALKAHVRRLERLAGKLTDELAQAARADEHQNYGDQILAHLKDARIVGATIRVPDLHHPTGEEVSVPADPRLSPQGNAERHYARARKLRRGAGTIRARLESTRDALRKAALLEEELERAATPEDLRRIESGLVESKILGEPKARPGARLPSPDRSDAGIRKFRTGDGFVILVGRTSRDNDRLTLHVAAPHDFWFHTADRSGAHVVVRNPSRLKELPKPVLLAAARIAAHFSRSRGKGKVEVHYTLRKYVRKGKGLGPGLVTIRNHRSIEVKPGIPSSEEDE